jgi:hypothetical protein
VTNVKESYQDLVETMRALGSALIPATAAQYDAPPRMRPSKDSVSESKGVRNPTLEIVLDPRRLGLSEEIDATATALRQARALLNPHVHALQTAVARWEGSEGD